MAIPMARNSSSLPVHERARFLKSDLNRGGKGDEYFELLSFGATTAKGSIRNSSDGDSNSTRNESRINDGDGNDDGDVE